MPTCWLKARSRLKYTCYATRIIYFKCDTHIPMLFDWRFAESVFRAWKCRDELALFCFAVVDFIYFFVVTLSFFTAFLYTSSNMISVLSGVWNSVEDMIGNGHYKFFHRLFLVFHSNRYLIIDFNNKLLFAVLFQLITLTSMLHYGY